MALTETPPDGTFVVYNQMVYPITKEITQIGRKSSNDIVIQKPGVSRVHAQIHYEEGQFILYDINSSNGTFINDMRITKGKLKPGTIFYIGDVAMVFVQDKKVTNSLEMDTGELDKRKK